MCAGARFYLEENQFINCYFPNPKAQLPVLTRNGHRVMVPWGRREQQPGTLPAGGWARRESIKKDTWARFNPRPVKVVMEAFMEKDALGKSHWFPLAANQFIQGLVATDATGSLLYIVTEENPRSCHPRHRWPRILTSPEAIPRPSSGNTLF